MKYLLLISVMTFWFTANSQSPGKVEEKTAVENALLDYIEGWYKGDTVRIDRSLHDDLVKRIPIKDSSDSDIKLRMVPKSVMVELTGKGGGENPDAEYQIFVDDIEKDIATARVLSPEYLDYLHLAKTNEGWQIVNILFRKR
ncbi:nuclear transport factor 2 family protein [Flagellimonas meridianipacifica]|uniref:Putative lumazine-binding protein n=1 Tax=Flagellimonas meridianipacifica TaxID=1080225 RepID=A0A2T0MIX5_9FLAO|nr:nuclear transport factor 2 family protein [Allomuricauda pacifica]PRX57509.1 putative lumazine-binding protein [Allomuricauda pacifica]